MDKPVIGITTFCAKEPRKVYTKVSYNYINSVSLAGGIPVLIPLLNKTEDIEKYIELIDGLLLSGGEDVCPREYGENPIKEVTMINPDRDEWELKLYKKAYESNMPILGICRGLQLINIAEGGSLYQDIYQQVNDVLGHLSSDTEIYHLYHSIEIEEKSKLFDIFSSNRIDVNSYHHQAVKDLAPGFKVTARSEEGIIEAIEDKKKNFVIGIQWHPEDLTMQHSEFIKLFKALVDKARILY
ncbi:gamma-glutamyl-gamma-aminobutyrate hydrolase family protein [Orenia marismortui]|uniref:gamma-glutamyl-gamma-aminobutyrate hydrolase family protein n=1 Tax=Orenia marismortui TaxID=46469 RepID=UPI0003676F34|nr:gamma-glutamyl-gamma-aminobutyrate hydrolase family protein [Orenia marismortui]